MMLWSRTLRMAERSRCHLRGSRVWRTGHRRNWSNGVSLLVARGYTGRIWMKISAWRVSWRVADLARLRSLFVGGSSGGNPKKGDKSITLARVPRVVPKSLAKRAARAGRKYVRPHSQGGRSHKDAWHRVPIRQDCPRARVSRSGLYIQSATMDPWSFPGSNGTMTTSSISQGTNSARRRWRKSSPAATRSGAPARSVTSHWVRRSTAVWLSSYFAAYPEDESG